MLINLVVAKIFPPTFSLTQSFLEGASGVETSVVLLRVKSVGSLICALAGQSGLSREGRSGVLGMLDAEWAELRERESASASGLGESPPTSGSSESVYGTQTEWVHAPDYCVMSRVNQC